MRRPFVIITLCILPVAAHAQIKQKFTIHNGKMVSGTQAAGNSSSGSSKITINQAQEVIFKAQQSLMKGDYAGAEALYSQAIALDNSNIQAYLHRGVVRRERRDYQGMDADARIALALTNNAIRANPRDPDGYYERSLALRLLYQFDQARKDVLAAMQLGGKPSLKNDLQAIELERKIAASKVQSAMQ